MNDNKVSLSRSAAYARFFDSDGGVSHDAIMREDVRVLCDKINQEVRQHLAAVCKFKSNPGSYVDLLALLDEKLHRIHAIVEISATSNEISAEKRPVNRC